MNTLELKSELHTSETDDNLYIVSAIFVDGEAVVDFRSYATLLIELKQSVTSSGTFFILTCWCGEPSCAGIYKGVKVVHNEKEKTVQWIISDPPPQREFIFDSSDYEYAITQGIEQIKREVSALWFTVSGAKDDKLQVVPELEDEMALLEPKPRVKARHLHRST